MNVISPSRGMQEDYKHRVYSCKSSDAGSALLATASPNGHRRSYEFRRPSGVVSMDNRHSSSLDCRLPHRLSPSPIDRRHLSYHRNSTSSNTHETQGSSFFFYFEIKSVAFRLCLCEVCTKKHVHKENSCTILVVSVFFSQKWRHCCLEKSVMCRKHRKLEQSIVDDNDYAPKMKVDSTFLRPIDWQDPLGKHGGKSSIKSGRSVFVAGIGTLQLRSLCERNYFPRSVQNPVPCF